MRFLDEVSAQGTTTGLTGLMSSSRVGMSALKLVAVTALCTGTFVRHTHNVRSHAVEALSRGLCPVMISDGGAEEMETSARKPAARRKTSMKMSNAETNSFDVDTQLINPWSKSSDNIPGLERFKRLVREDYLLAEALWAGLFCSLGVGAGMQLVRAYIAATTSESLFRAEAELLSATEIVSGYIMSPAAEAAAAAAAQVDLDSAAEAVAVLIAAAVVTA